MICALPFHPCIKNIAGGKSGVSTGTAAAANGVWPRGKACRAEHGGVPKKAEPPHPHRGPGHAARTG